MIWKLVSRITIFSTKHIKISPLCTWMSFYGVNLQLLVCGQYYTTNIMYKNNLINSLFTTRYTYTCISNHCSLENLMFCLVPAAEANVSTIIFSVKHFRFQKNQKSISQRHKFYTSVYDKLE